LPNIALKLDFSCRSPFCIFSPDGDRIRKLKFNKYQRKSLNHLQTFFKLVFLPGKIFGV